MKHSAPFALLVVLAISGCAQSSKPEPYVQAYDSWLGLSVNAGDGIDRDEASVIAYAFYSSGVPDCGSPLESRLVDDDWISNTLTDSGKPGKPIYIDAKTGNVSCGDVLLSLDELRKFRRGVE